MRRRTTWRWNFIEMKEVGAMVQDDETGWSNVTPSPRSLILGFTPINQMAGCDALPSNEAADETQAPSRKRGTISRGNYHQSPLSTTSTTGKQPCRLGRSAGKRKHKDQDSSRYLLKKNPILSGNTLSNRILKYVGEDILINVEDLATQSSSDTVFSSTAKNTLAAFVHRDTSQNGLSDFVQGINGTILDHEHIENVPASADDGFLGRKGNRYLPMPDTEKSVKVANQEHPLLSVNASVPNTGKKQLLGSMPENPTRNVPSLFLFEDNFNEEDFLSKATPKGIDYDRLLNATNSTPVASMFNPASEYTRSITEVPMQQEAAIPSLGVTKGLYEEDLCSIISYLEDASTINTDYKESTSTLDDDEFSVIELESMEHFHVDNLRGASSIPYQPRDTRPEISAHDLDCGTMEMEKKCMGSAAKKLPAVQADFSGLTESESPSAGTLVYVDLTVEESAANKRYSTADDGNGSQNYSDDGLDSVLLELTTAVSTKGQVRSSSATIPATIGSPKLQWLPPREYMPRKQAPSLFPRKAANAPHTTVFDTHGNALPFVRPPFPKSVRNRSPIIGLTNQTVLRTCFRIGEALNAAAIASRSNTEAIVELYARVLHSERQNGSVSQHFQFSDLFTADKPPYISGTYDLWKSSDLWEHDSKAFLGPDVQGKIARVVGKIKRNDKGLGCKMMILSIWEANWEDIGWVKGIVCA